LSLNRKKYWDKRETDSSKVDFTFKVIFGIPLEKKAINVSMVLTQRALSRIETKTHIESSVSSSFY